ncbi:MAG: formate/nitrite transporter family protein [Solirubrobacterales bacterium]|nr:formate/nitrite transporter family protein [Solirubrobacterales bacterium]
MGEGPEAVKDYVAPDQVVELMAAAGTKKAGLAIRDLLIRGFMSGMILALATAVALSAVAEGSPLWVGALLFPFGFVLLVLLGFELVTGNFALVPTALFDGRVTGMQLARNWGWVFVGNLIGSICLAVLLYLTLTEFGQVDGGPLAELLVEKAEAKTLAYSDVGTAAGVATAFVKAVLCNWMVATGTVMALVSTSVPGKIFGMWLPIFAFFAMGFEHSVVNMFVIPAGILFGDTLTIGDWWQWNEITVTIGNVVGALVFVAMVMYYTHGPRNR